MTQEVLVLYTHDVDRMKTFFEGLGLEFVQEQHGTGPVHFACAYENTVLEIYPTLHSEYFKYVSD